MVLGPIIMFAVPPPPFEATATTGVVLVEFNGPLVEMVRQAGFEIVSLGIGVMVWIAC